MRRERCGQFAVGVAMDVAFDAARHDFLLAVVALGVGEQRGDQQRLLHHESVHGALVECRGAEGVQAGAGARSMRVGEAVAGALHVALRRCARRA